MALRSPKIPLRRSLPWARTQQQQHRRPSATLLTRQFSTTASSASAAAAAELKKTALYDFHVANKGSMVPYAGWKMPLGYKGHSTTQVHKHCREEACLFDVSHMGQLRLLGRDREQFIETLVPGNIKDLKMNRSRLTQFTTEKGGMMDDLLVTKKEDHLYVVVNAGCVEQDVAHLQAHIERVKGEMDVSLEVMDSHSLIALQGPKAVEVLQRYLKTDLKELAFMTSMDVETSMGPCRVGRCGYTGEDGFEISLPNENAVAFVERLAAEPEVLLAGLGPRDTLRLEAGLCLMGHDIMQDITPIEAGLGFTIGKRRREEGGFPGAEVILKQMREGVDKTRIGFLIDGRAAAREGYAIYDANGEKQIGTVTSGSLAPCLENKTIGMGYVPKEFADSASQIVVDLRGKMTPATISSMPFVPHRYYKKPKK